MKKLLITIMALGFSMGIAAFAGDNPTAPKDVVVGITDAYIPSGFDAGSDAFVVINGLFANSCYRMKDAEVTHVNDTLHEVRAKASVSQGMCLMVLVPFTKEVQLGKLKSGTHSIRFMSGDGTYMDKQLVVE